MAGLSREELIERPDRFLGIGLAAIMNKRGRDRCAFSTSGSGDLACSHGWCVSHGKFKSTIKGVERSGSGRDDADRSQWRAQ